MSIKATEIAFVCYSITDLKRARAFYEELLGLAPTSVFEGNGMAFIEYELGAHTLAIGLGAPKLKPGIGGGTVALEVEDFPQAIQRLRDAGVPVFMEQMETPVCFMAAVTDPDGNVIMIHKRKPGHN